MARLGETMTIMYRTYSTYRKVARKSCNIGIYQHLQKIVERDGRWPQEDFWQAGIGGA